MAGQLLPFDGFEDRRVPKELAQKMGRLPRFRKCPDQEDIGGNYVGACMLKTRDPKILEELYAVKTAMKLYRALKTPPSP